MRKDFALDVIKGHNYTCSRHLVEICNLHIIMELWHVNLLYECFASEVAASLPLRLYLVPSTFLQVPFFSLHKFAALIYEAMLSVLAHGHRFFPQRGCLMTY